MRVPRAPLADLSEGDRALEGPTAHYLARVLRLREGDAFVAFDPRAGREADGEVMHLGKARLDVRIGPLRAASVATLRPVVWIQGLAKGDKLDAIVRDATELGVTRFVPVVTKRSVVKLDPPRAEAKRARWARIADEAARQCGRSEAPTIDPPCTLDEALTREDPSVARFFLYERATVPLAPPLVDALARGDALSFVAGPEGGFDEEEVGLAERAGFTVVSLGSLILRAETVAAAVLGATRVLLGLG